MRGRKPKPSAIKKLEGNPGKRPIKEDIACEIPAEITDPPRILQKIENETMKAEAIAEWNRVAPMLVQIRVLKALDVNTLARYCIAWAQYVDAALNTLKYGSLLKSKTGQPYYSPFFNQQRTLDGALTSLGALFGLDPSSRSRFDVQEGKEKEEGEIEAFLKAGKKLRAVK